jgi:hypothetical protein
VDVIPHQAVGVAADAETVDAPPDQVEVLEMVVGVLEYGPAVVAPRPDVIELQRDVNTERSSHVLPQGKG